METKNKIIKISKVCNIISKVFYCLACALCLIFAILAVALYQTNPIKSLSPSETAILFGTLSFYSFMAIGLLWNIEQIFRNILKEQTPFCERTIHYTKKTAIFLILISTIPALLGSIILRAICPETELNFSIELGGIIAGIMILLFCLFIKYGEELETKKKN